VCNQHDKHCQHNLVPYFGIDSKTMNAYGLSIHHDVFLGDQCTKCEKIFYHNKPPWEICFDCGSLMYPCNNERTFFVCSCNECGGTYCARVPIPPRRELAATTPSA
jgi:hypothetical protein